MHLAMHLDRALFLACVATLSACPATRPVEVGGPPAKSDGPRGFRPDAPADPHPVDVHDDFPGPSAEALGVFRPEVGCGEPIFMGPKKSSKTKVAGAVASYPKQGVDCFGTFACTGDDELAQLPPSCEALAGCDDDGPSRPAMCKATLTVLKPRIATRAMVCMKELADFVCQPGLRAACREHALLRACDDGGADASCLAIEKACPKTTRRECRAYLSGMTESGRSNVVSCMKDDCVGGLRDCVDEVVDISSTSSATPPK